MNNRPLNMGSTTPGRYMLVRFAVKIEKIYKNWVLLERPLPFNIRPEFSPLVFNRGEWVHPFLPAPGTCCGPFMLSAFSRSPAVVGTVFDSGIEGVHFLFKWCAPRCASVPDLGERLEKRKTKRRASSPPRRRREKARPHHYEAGYNAIEFKEVFDCWARDVQITNPDDGIFIDKSTGVQINDLSILQTQPRGGGKGPDGHWGVHSGGWLVFGTPAAGAERGDSRVGRQDLRTRHARRGGRPGDEGPPAACYRSRAGCAGSTPA